MAQGEYEDGRGAPMPDYVGEILLARYIGVPVTELEHWPAGVVEQYAMVRAAELTVERERHKQQGQ